MALVWSIFGKPDLDPSDLDGAMLRYLKLNSYRKKLELVQRHSEIFLSEDMIETVRQFILRWQLGSENSRVMQLRQDQMLFRLCQRMPAPEAFARLDPFFKSPVANAVRALLEAESQPALLEAVHLHANLLRTPEALATAEDHVLFFYDDDARRTQALLVRDYVRALAEGDPGPPLERLLARTPMVDRLQELLAQLPKDPSELSHPWALEVMREILTLQPRDVDPRIWATLRVSLAANLLESSRSENIEEAIELCQAAMDVFETEPASVDYARALAVTGSCFVERTYGDRRDNIEIALRLLDGAMKKVSALRETDDSTDLTLVLAGCYLSIAGALNWRIDGNQQENLELAHASARSAMDLYQHLDRRIDWANAATVDGGVLARLRGESHAENVERAISLLKEVLEAFPKDSPGSWLAMVHNNLAVAYGARIVGDQRVNASKSALHSREGLRLIERQSAPRLWAQLSGSLGTALSRAATTDAMRMQAVRHLEDALSVYGPEQDPSRFVLFKRGLGLVLAAMDGTDRAADAVQHLRDAWEIATAELDPVRHAELRKLAANVISRSRGEAAPEVADHLLAALSAEDPQRFAAERFETCAALGAARLAAGRWEEAWASSS